MAERKVGEMKNEYEMKLKEAENMFILELNKIKQELDESHARNKQLEKILEIAAIDPGFPFFFFSFFFFFFFFLFFFSFLLFFFFSLFDYIIYIYN